MDIPAVNELVKNFVLDMEIVHYNLVAVIAVVDYSFAGLVFDSRLSLVKVLFLFFFFCIDNILDIDNNKPTLRGKSRKMHKR